MNFRILVLLLASGGLQALFGEDKGVTLSLSGKVVFGVRDTSKGNWTLAYCIDGPRLGYAVIVGPWKDFAKSDVPLTTGKGTASPEFAILRTPDGHDIPILASGRVFQLHDDKLIELHLQISGSEFQAFLDSKPDDYSLDAVAAFVARYRATPK